MVTKYRDRELQMMCPPEKIPQARKSVALTEHVACPLVCAQFRDGKYWARPVVRDDRRVISQGAEEACLRPESGTRICSHMATTHE
jgi:hypothetical protein